MSINHSIIQAGGAPDFSAEGLSCAHCHTDRQLIVESIQQAESRCADMVSIEYRCGRCESIFIHDSSWQSASKLLAMRGSHDAGILKFGNHYFHCGEPMTQWRTEISSVNVSDEDLAVSPAVVVPTAALHCHCGFRISVPR